MPSFTDVQPGDPLNSSCVQQIVSAFTGAAGKGVPISVSAVNDPAAFALDVRNQDLTNGRAFRVRDSSNNILIQADASGVTLNQVTVSSGTITGSTFVNPRLTNANVSTTSPGVLSARLDSTHLDAPAPTMTLSVTSPGYGNLGLHVYGACGTLTAPGADSVLMQCNNDTAANYDHMLWYVSTVPSVAITAVAGSTGANIGVLPASSGAAAMSGQVVATINSYGANAAMHHTGYSDWCSRGNTSTNAFQIGKNAFFWRSTAAITSIVLSFAAGGSFSSGSGAVLTGLP